MIHTDAGFTITSRIFAESGGFIIAKSITYNLSAAEFWRAMASGADKARGSGVEDSGTRPNPEYLWAVLFGEVEFESLSSSEREILINFLHEPKIKNMCGCLYGSRQLLAVKYPISPDEHSEIHPELCTDIAVVNMLNILREEARVDSDMDSAMRIASGSIDNAQIRLEEAIETLQV